MPDPWLASAIKGTAVTGCRYTLTPGFGGLIGRVDSVGHTWVFIVQVSDILNKNMVLVDFANFMGTPSGVEMMAKVPKVQLIGGTSVWVPCGSICVAFTWDSTPHSELWFQPLWVASNAAKLTVETVRAIKEANVANFTIFRSRSEAWKKMEDEFVIFADDVISKY